MPEPSSAALEQGLAQDVIDRAAGLVPGGAVQGVRQGRQKVARATQQSYELFFDPSGTGISCRERLLIAFYACQLSRADGLAQHYRDQVPDDAALCGRLEADVPDASVSPRLAAMLVFTQTLICRPAEGDREAIRALRHAGLEDPDIVTLAQLIAFLSYQIRMVVGLRALQATESK